VVRAGGITCIVGPSGSGKSSLLRLCNRLDVPTTGTVELRGEDVATLDPLLLRRRVGMVFQRPTPFAGTVVENLRVARPELASADAAALLTRVGLDPALAQRPAHELSGGESQRVCLARTLATEPEVLLMDEPTSALDGAARSVLEDLTRGLVRDGVSVLWVTHDLAQMRRLADDVLVLLGGRIEHAAPLASVAAGAPPAVTQFLCEPGGSHA
jgi:putative ABC transport system ATP-binding protein